MSVQRHNTSQVCDDKLSPLCKTRLRNDEKRLEDLRVASIETKIKWHIAILTLNTVDHLVFSSSILSFFLFFTLPIDVISTISSFLSIYLGAVIMFLLIEMKFPAIATIVSGTLNSMKRKNVDNKNNKSTVPPTQKPSETSFLETSWLDAHHFGTPNQVSKINLSSRSPSSSKKSPLVATPSSLDVSASWKSPTSYSKATDSIHTRKQLDVLLRSHANDSPIDPNSTNNSYFSTLWHSFDGKSPSHLNNSYQLSEELKNEPGTSPYQMKIGKNGLTEVTMLRRRKGENEVDEDEKDDELTKLHKIMNAAKTTPDPKSALLKRSNSTDRGRSGLRRRSHSSPDKSMDFYGSDAERYRSGELLTEEQQRRAEFRVRAWIRNTILLPLSDEIEEINRVLEKDTPTYRIGKTPVDTLKTAFMERDNLKSTNLPFVLPFLTTHTNQAYLVSRIKELSSTESMEVYKWNGGGMEPAEDKLNTSRLVRREWNETLPTDAILIFDLFCVYMDAQLNSNCLVGDHRLDQPFTGRYVVKYPKKAFAAQRAPFNFYLHMSSMSPPNFELIHNDSTGSAIKCVVARQSSNLFRAIAQFIHYVKEENHGYIDQINIGPSGINILCVLN